MNMLVNWKYLIAVRPRDHKGWDGNGGIPAQHTPMNGSREIGRRVGYRKYSEQLSGYPTIQSAMEGGFSKRVNLAYGFASFHVVLRGIWIK